uniref:Uncharacterized protein n=1 Tax=Populus trichocarpa TaxID=3694 RepID=A0A2K1YWF1_POPTR
MQQYSPLTRLLGDRRHLTRKVYYLHGVLYELCLINNHYTANPLLFFSFPTGDELLPQPFKCLIPRDLSSLGRFIFMFELIPETQNAPFSMPNFENWCKI